MEIKPYNQLKTTTKTLVQPLLGTLDRFVLFNVLPLNITSKLLTQKVTTSKKKAIIFPVVEKVGGIILLKYKDLYRCQFDLPDINKSFPNCVSAIVSTGTENLSIKMFNTCIQVTGDINSERTERTVDALLARIYKLSQILLNISGEADNVSTIITSIVESYNVSTIIKCMVETCPLIDTNDNYLEGLKETFKKLKEDFPKLKSLIKLFFSHTMESILLKNDSNYIMGKLRWVTRIMSIYTGSLEKKYLSVRLKNISLTINSGGSVIHLIKLRNELSFRNICTRYDSIIDDYLVVNMRSRDDPGECQTFTIRPSGKILLSSTSSESNESYYELMNIFQELGIYG